jgi:hypothetical protein
LPGSCDDCPRLRAACSCRSPDRAGRHARGGPGDTAFTVPLFDEFMKRIVRGDDWQQ